MFSLKMILDHLPEQINQLNPSFVSSVLLLALICLLAYIFIAKRSPKVFLLDFACYKPPPSQMSSKERFLERFKVFGNSNEANLEFMKKCLMRSGLGDKTYLPASFLRDPPDLGLQETRQDVEDVMYGAVDAVLEKTGVNPKDIGILIVTCTVLNVEPSLADMIVNRYKLGDNVRVYNMVCMGCSAGLRAVGLAQSLLKVHPNTYALLVSPENVYQVVYRGNDKSKILMNFPLRVGGAAVLLSNRPSDHDKAKLQLLHTVHTHTAAADHSYRSIYDSDDNEGLLGVNVSRELLVAAIGAVEANIRSLGPLVLPYSEQFRYIVNYLTRRFNIADVKPYTPNFKKGIQHVFPHVGTKPVLDEFEKNLGFDATDVEAARMNLYRFGNTCSASVWYSVSYSEAKRRIKKGENLWLITFGSGFKCSSAVWRALRNIDNHDELNPWIDEIDEFPVDLRNMQSFAEVFDAPKRR